LKLGRRPTVQHYPVAITYGSMYTPNRWPFQTLALYKMSCICSLYNTVHGTSTTDIPSTSPKPATPSSWCMMLWTSLSFSFRLRAPAFPRSLVRRISPSVSFSCFTFLTAVPVLCSYSRPLVPYHPRSVAVVHHITFLHHLMFCSHFPFSAGFASLPVSRRSEMSC